MRRFCTFQLVCFGWLLFRAPTVGTAWIMLQRLVTAWGFGHAVSWLLVVTIVVSIAVQYVPAVSVSELQAAFSRLRPLTQGAILGAVLLACTTLAPEGVQAFIYYRF